MKDHEIIDVIGEAAAVALAEECAGVRLYVPAKVTDDHVITRAIGRAAAEKLSAFYSPTTIHVPLLRRLRAERLRQAGLSNAKIAVRLGMTENGVEKIFARRRASEGARA